jgi:hypothetical protein
MDRKAEIQAQTALRRQMLANGYTPLANKDKMCILHAWPSLAVDGAQIDVWSSQLKWRATGVRIERGLVAIDLDVNDDDAIDAIIHALPADIWALLRDAPVRRGKGAKEAWFCRLAEGESSFYRLTSAGYRQPDSAPDDTVHRVEIFAGDTGRQFGAYGAHTIGHDGEVEVQYRWEDGRGLADVPFDDLPRLTRAQLAKVGEVASAVLAELGWVHDKKSKEGFSSPAVIYDLDDQQFETREHGLVDLEGLSLLVSGADTVRLSASWLEGPSASNTTRCLAYRNPSDGQVAILETASYETHRPVTMMPKPLNTGALDRLEALAGNSTLFDRPAPAPVAETAQVGIDMRDDMERVVDHLIGEVAFCASEQRCVMPIDADASQSMTMANFRVLMQPSAVEVRGPRGGSQVIHPVALWASDPRRVDVSGHRFRPDLAGQRLYVEDGAQYINTYRPTHHVDVDAGQIAAAGAAFEALLSHLVPHEGARDWFRMWLASKVQYPATPNCGVIMVAEIQGTGRGTLFDMMTAALGQKHVRNISSTELMGGQGQGQYNDWIANALLVLCEEVMAGDDAGGAMAWKRREVYERLKQLVDPRQRVMEIRRKNLSNYSAEIFASILMATNHMNALPLDETDRRIAVLVQPNLKFDDVPKLMRLINPLRVSGRYVPWFGAGLCQYLHGVAVDTSALRIAPELGEGRALMRASNLSDLDHIMSEVLDDIPADFITNAALKRRLGNALTAAGEIDSTKNWWGRAQDVLKRPNGTGWARMQVRQVTGGTDAKRTFETVYYRVAGAGQAAWEGMGRDARAVALSRSSDINDMATRIDRGLRDHGIHGVT